MAAFDPVTVDYRHVPELKEFFLEDVQRTGQKLGSGAFGTVEELKVGGTLSAGKKLHATLLDAQNQGTDRMIKRFISECKLLSRLRHPCIVQFMGLCMFSKSEHPILVMEKLDFNLENVLDTYSNVPLPLMIRIFKDIIKGLIHLHSQKPAPVIHRDLTARNILITKASMSAKIADLGNALMVDPVKFSTTLSQAPGTLPYMPPEALQVKPNYDSMLDMFSFGHLALYAIVQEYPGDLLPATYADPLTEIVKGRSEVERREKYIRMLYSKLTEGHVLTKMILQCLHNMPERRLTATKIMEQLNSVYSDENDPYEAVNLITLISNPDEEKSRLTESLTVETSILKRRIKELKGGVPGVLDIYRLHGRVKLARRQDWRSQAFQIKDGFLKYFKNVKDKPHDELDLSLVVKVRATPPKENMAMFHFEIHFAEKRGSPWLLRAYTQDERSSWMEAIEPGSSNSMGSPITDSYEIVSSTQQDEAYSYVHHSGKYLQESQQPVIYDVPDTPSKMKAIRQASNTSFSSPGPAIYEDLYDTSTLHLKQQNSKLNPSVAGSEDEDGELYEDLPDPSELYMEDEESAYVEMEPRSTISRSSTIPRTLESVSEITLENLTNLDQKQAQLWMLLQMQKLVQRMGDVYEPVKPSANNQPKVEPSTSAPAPVFHQPEETEEAEYDDDIGNFPPDEQPNRSDLYVNLNDLEIVDDQQATRQELYINLDSISAALAAPTPPPIPPKTYRQLSADADSLRDRTQSDLPSKQESKSENQVLQRSKTFSECNPRRGNVASSLPTAHATVTTIQKRKTSKAEIISTLKASNRAISSEIESHLVTDDDAGTIYTPGKRPEWTKAKTRSSGLEESLADLHREALFLSRSTLSDLKDIGQGQYGKVYKGLYRKSQGPGHPVAIKTIKQYESEKEKDEFLKEMNVMSKLMHPNIVRLFGLVQQDEPWIVLEYLPHGDLKHFLMDNKKPVERLLKYMLDVSTGMHYISEKGLVHRDLAARNIMVGQDEICKVGDFGLLRELPKDVEIYVAKTKVAFPIRWMAPESLMRKEFSPATDVWSFGIVMWEMYNPKVKPYKGMNNTQVAVYVNQGEHLPIPEEYPPTVISIMKACWQKSPSKRPSFLLISSLLTKLLWQ